MLKYFRLTTDMYMYIMNAYIIGKGEMSDKNHTKMTPTRLRKELFVVLDEIAKGKLEVEVMRKGFTILISRKEEVPISKLQRMRSFKRQSVLNSPIDEVENIEWSETWEPKID